MVPFILTATLLAVPTAGVHGSDVTIPDAARQFVAAGTKPLAFEVADLNRDGRQDAILVLEPLLKPGEDEFAERERSLLILVGQPDGSLREAARNEGIAFCSSCGGSMGDPFQGVDVGPGTFTVANGGGSGWRWFYEYTFNYSRRDQTWQLVRVKEVEGQPTTAEVKMFTPPRHFGKIDIAAFDPSNWKNQGAR